MPRMRTDEQEVLEILIENFKDDSFVVIQYDLIEEFTLDARPLTRLFVRGLLELMAISPETDWGIPGPFVSLMEKSAHHVDELLRVWQTYGLTEILLIQFKRHANGGSVEAFEALEQIAAGESEFVEDARGYLYARNAEVE